MLRRSKCAGSRFGTTQIFSLILDLSTFRPGSKCVGVEIFSLIFGLKQRAKTIVELTGNASFYAASVPLNFTEKAQILFTEEALGHLSALAAQLETIPYWSEEAIEQAVRSIAESADIKLGKLAQPLRAALTGSTVSPGIFEVAAILERAETLARIKAVCGTAQ